MPTSATISAGRIQICALKKRTSVNVVNSVPPRSALLMKGPMNGIVSVIEVPTVVAQNARWFQGSRYPVKPMPSVSRSSTTPVTQVISRGYL